MVELVIVVVIMGIIAAIAAPRFNGMADRAKERRLIADLATLQKAAELFSAEHRGLCLGKTQAGTAVSDGTLAARLRGATDDDGTVDPSGLYGPYVRSVPTNALNGKATVRVDGAVAGAGTHGWRFDTPTGTFQADTEVEVTLPDGSVATHKGAVIKVGDAVEIKLGG